VTGGVASLFKTGDEVFYVGLIGVAAAVKSPPGNCCSIGLVPHPA